MDKRQLDNLMQRVKRGDEAAFSQLYTETKAGVFSYAYGILSNKAAAEDVMQEVYLTVRTKCGQYRDGTNPLAWLLQITKNLAIGQIRTESRIAPFEEDLAAATETDAFVEADTPVADAVRALLKEEEAQIVLLHVVSGLKHREIAALLGKPLGSVLWSYNNSMTKLKKQLSK